MIVGPLSVLLLMGAATAIPAGAATAATTTDAGANPNLCIVTLHVTATQATATIDSGCTGGGYHLVAYTAQSNQRALSYPQRLYAEADAAPYVVSLPPCFQVDFGRNQRATVIRGLSPNEPLSGPASPGASTIGPVFSTTTQGFIAGELGGTDCPTPPPTTTPPTTTPPTTTPPTTTTVPPTTASTSATTLPPGTSTNLTPTLAPVPSGTTTATTPSSVPVAKPSAVATAPTKQLASTGVSSGALAAIGLAMIGLGSAAVALTRRLRRPRAD